MSFPQRDRTVSYNESWNDRRLQSLRSLERMIRLRPSELALTSGDVDETFRRLAYRQSSRPRADLHRHPASQSGRPILRRGPRRSTQDAITALGSIPILEPRQAAFASMEDEDTEHASGQQVAPSIEHDDFQRPISPTHDREAESEYSRVDSTQSPASPVWSLRSSESPRRHSLHLPFRFGRSRRPSTTQSQPDASVPVSRTPARPPFGHARMGSTGDSSIGDTSNTSTQSPSGGSIQSTSGLRGGGKLTRDPRDTPHAPSPLHHMQRPSSSADQEPLGDPTKSPTTPHEDNLPHYLQGYWHDTPDRIKYRFQEITGDHFWNGLPHSEPRRVSHRQPSAMRSSSSGPAPSRLTRQGRSSSGTLFDDVFVTLPATEPRGRRNTMTSAASRGEDYYSALSDNFHTSGGSLQPEQTSGRPRQFSSDASGASAQFSYYGSLPPSTRDSSNEHSLEHDLSRLQLDGAVGSNEYTRVSASGVPSAPHGTSPLPSMPYTRNQGDQPLTSNNGNVGGNIIDATTAAMQGLESPLNSFVEHYRRQRRAPQVREVAHRAPTDPNFYEWAPAHGPRPSRPPHLPNGPSSRISHPPQLPNGPRMMGSRQPEEHSLQPNQHSFEYPNTQPDRIAQGEERSSENYPDRSSVHQDQMAQTMGRVRAQRAAYERLLNPGMPMQVETDMQPFRHSMPQPTIPHNRSHRPHPPTAAAPLSFEDILSSQFIRPQSRYPPQVAATTAPPRNEADLSSRFIGPQSRHHFPDQASHPLSAGAPPRVPTRQGYHQHNSGPPQRLPTRLHRPVPGARHLNPARDSPLTALALDQGSGTTSRRSHSPLIRATTTARTYRRVPPEQRDQENDGDRAVMRREEENVNARYGEEDQTRDTMNETPPRIGRVERRMQE